MCHFFTRQARQALCNVPCSEILDSDNYKRPIKAKDWKICFLFLKLGHLFWRPVFFICPFCKFFNLKLKPAMTSTWNLDASNYCLRQIQPFGLKFFSLSNVCLICSMDLALANWLTAQREFTQRFPHGNACSLVSAVRLCRLLSRRFFCACSDAAARPLRGAFAWLDY